MVGLLLLGHYSNRSSYWIGCEAVGKEDALPRVTFKKVIVCDGDSHQTPELSN